MFFKYRIKTLSINHIYLHLYTFDRPFLFFHLDPPPATPVLVFSVSGFRINTGHFSDVDSV